MPFRITITEDAQRQFLALTVREQRILEAGMVARLLHQPTSPSRAVKVLRPNPVAGYELRVGDLRVLYDVEGHEVVVIVVGRKVGNALVVDGEEFYGHQERDPGSPGGRPGGDSD